jgi:hypothetical protein
LLREKNNSRHYQECHPFLLTGTITGLNGNSSIGQLKSMEVYIIRDELLFGMPA